jgi:hypothetical protein
MEQAPRARAPRRDEAGENAVLKTKLAHHRVKAVWEQAKAGEQEGVPAEAKARERAAVAVEVAEEAAAIGSKKSTVQLINDN